MAIELIQPKGNINLTDKASGGKVKSVNGMIGDVVLTADDVGAVSKDTYKNEYYYGDANIEPTPITDFTYEEDDNTVYLTGLTQDAKYDDILEVVIPYEAFGKKVALRQYDFLDISSYTETLILPRGLKMEGYHFHGGNYITKLVLPQDIKVIPWQSFIGLSQLKEVVIPDGVVQIYNNAFMDCISLQRIVIPDSVVSIDESDEMSFNGVPRTATIVCSAGSRAEAFAKAMGFRIEYTGIVIDEKPTEGSNNPVSSNGVYVALGDVETALDNIIAMQEALIGGDA